MTKVPLFFWQALLRKTQDTTRTYLRLLEIPVRAYLDDRVVVSVRELRAVELAEGVLHAFLVAEVHHAPTPVVHVGVVNISGL